jgi:uncharacterized protein DUF4430
VLRRTLLVAALAAALAPAALATTAHVRVEGKTQTIFGAAEPLATGSNALETLESASLAGEFYYHVTQSSFGPYVDQVGRYGAAGSGGWVFKVNGASPPVGADKVALKDGDRVLWYYATFSPEGAGPPTLDLRAAGKGCYTVVKQDDQGKETPAVGAVLKVDGRSVKTAAGKTCPGPHKSLVRATLDGTIRSNALK